MSAAAASALQGLRSRHAGARVLLADADELRRLQLESLLREAGLQPAIADSGFGALDLAARRRHALMLLAPGLPGLDGADLLRSLRALPQGRGVPLLALVNDPAADVAAREATDLAAATLAWPVAPDTLYAALLQLLAPAPTEAPAALPAILAALYGQDGIDVDAGLDAVGNNPAIYRRLLQVFVNTHGQDGAVMQGQQQAGDLDALAATAHHIRGAAATLGLVDVERAATRLEDAADRSLLQPSADPQLPALALALGAALAQVLPVLRRALQN